MEQPKLPSGVSWGERTRAWWASLASVAGVDGWTSADWQFAMDTALVHDAVWNGGELELRQREQALGITPAARPAKSSVEVAVEKVTETPLQRITERRIERRNNASRKSSANV